MLEPIERFRGNDDLLGRAARAIDLSALRDAFDAGYQRTREDYYLNITYPSLQSMLPIDETVVAAHLDAAARRPLAVYVHVPFCSAQCSYCHYFKVFRPDDATIYATVDALTHEMASATRRLGRFAYQAIYIGGGTPSHLPSPMIRRLFTAIEACGSRQSDCEVTFEVHPENASPELFALLRELGVTRISMGIESLDDSILARENRRHTVRQALDAHALARQFGFATVNIDLIYGMEDQRAGDWQRAVEMLAELEPDSVTAYQLRVRTHSASLNRYHKAAERFASAAETLLMHSLTQQRLVREGDYRESPVDWYVRSDRPTHSYQTLNWRNADEVPLLGIGPSAYSYVDGCQYYNVNDLDQYVEAVHDDRLPVFRGEVFEPDERWRRSCVLGLKMGIDLVWLASVYGASAAERAREAAGVPISLGLITEDQNWLHLSDTGSLIADELARCFFSTPVRRRTDLVPSTDISTTSRRLNPAS